jgi:hypothetical protein
VRKLDRTQMGKSLKAMVARDGVEPPTPAFSGLYSPVVKRLNTKALRREVPILWP